MISIDDNETFLSFLGAISKFVPCAEFNVTPVNTTVYSMNLDHTVRAFFTTNIAHGDECMFALNEISKLSKSLALTKKTNQSQLNFDGQFLKTKGAGSFRLKTVKRDVIERYVSKPLTANLNTVMSFKMSKSCIKSLNSASAIIATDTAKLYLTMKDGVIVGEIDDKSNPLSDSISVPLVESAADINGNIESLMCLKLSDFLQILAFPADSYTVNYTDKNVFSVDADIFDDKNTVSVMNMKMLLSLLKI